MKKKNFIWLWIVIAIVAAIIIVPRFLMPKKKVSYKTVKVTLGTISSAVSATGTLNPLKSVDVGSEVSGKIKRLYVDYNSRVKKGQLLLQIDPTSFKARLDQAAANLDKAKILVKDATRNLNRQKDLFSQSLVAQSDLDDAQSAYDNAAAGMKQAQAAYDVSLKDLNNTTITSPINGIVISCPVSEGQTIAAGYSVTTLITIAEDLSKMQVEANVDEADIGTVKDGQTVTFTVDAFPERNFTGKVTQIRLSPEIVSRVVTYVVIIEVSNKDLFLKPGMTANVSIITQEKSNIFIVPNTAIRFKPQSEADALSSASSVTPVGPSKKEADASLKKVWILNKEGKLMWVQVKTGMANSEYTEILGNDVKEGYEVVVGINTNGNVKKKIATPFGIGGRTQSNTGTNRNRGGGMPH